MKTRGQSESITTAWYYYIVPFAWLTGFGVNSASTTVVYPKWLLISTGCYVPFNIFWGHKWWYLRCPSLHFIWSGLNDVIQSFLPSSETLTVRLLIMFHLKGKQQWSILSGQIATYLQYFCKYKFSSGRCAQNSMQLAKVIVYLLYLPVR